MHSLVFRLWVLLLVFLVQVGSWSAEASSRTCAASGSSPISLQELGDIEAPEDTSEDASYLDDSPGSDVLAAAVPDWDSAPVSWSLGRWVDGLPPGGPPSDTPFKPPRS